MILDNLESVKLIQSKLSIQQEIRHILITTRYGQVCPSLPATMTEISCLLELESLRMFTSLYRNLNPDDEEIQAAKEPIMKLDHLSLAIIQSVAYLSVESMFVSVYLKNYRKQHEESI